MKSYSDSTLILGLKLNAFYTVTESYLKSFGMPLCVNLYHSRQWLHIIERDKVTLSSIRCNVQVYTLCRRSEYVVELMPHTFLTFEQSVYLLSEITYYNNRLVERHQSHADIVLFHIDMDFLISMQPVHG